MPKDIKATKIICKKLSYRDARYESAGEMKAEIQKLTLGIALGKLDITILPFKAAKGMHDRYINFKVINAK
jgi:hypothetical protein